GVALDLVRHRPDGDDAAPCDARRLGVHAADVPAQHPLHTPGRQETLSCAWFLCSISGRVARCWRAAASETRTSRASRGWLRRWEARSGSRARSESGSAATNATAGV